MNRISLLQLSKRFNDDVSIQMRLLRLLYNNLTSSSLVILFNATLFIYILWPIVDRSLLGVWYGTLLLITAVRYIDAHRFLQQEAPDYAVWYRQLFLGVFLSALMWGMTPLLFFPKSEPIYQMFIIIVLTGMTSGALNTLAADLRLSFLYLFALMLPLAYRLLETGSDIYIVMFFLLVAFISIVTYAARQFHGSLVESYRNLELYHRAVEQLTSSENRLRMMFEQAPIGIFYYNTELVIVDVNLALCRAMHVERETLIGMHLLELTDKRPMQGAYPDGEYSKPSSYEGPYHSEVHGLDLWIKVEFMPIIDGNGKMMGGMAMLSDDTTEHAAMEQAELLSLHDPLTMLPNRKLLIERMQQLIKEGKRDARRSALLFLDLDRFKHINDSVGHVVGDHLLIQTADRLKHLLRESDTLSRLGGDEFVILLPRLSEERDKTVRIALQVAEKIHAALRAPYHIRGHVLYSSCSIGVATLENEWDTDEILRRADIAMYHAKDEGRDRTRFYDPAMDEKAHQYLETQQRLRHAIETDGFSIFYQPIVRLDTQRVVGAESLLRWRDAEGEEIPPSDFIPVAEESGLINAIGQWVINEVCRQISLWERDGTFAMEYVSVNLSPRQLLETGFADFILDSIKRYGISPSQLRLEITETALIRDFEKAKNVIESLNAEGIKFIIDDFGTGYSSLSYLKQLHFSALKIDKSFIRDILVDSNDAMLVRAIINIARQFGYLVIAEGIETAAQRDTLMKVDSLICYQGFLYSPALEAEAFINTLKSKSAKPA